MRKFILAAIAVLAGLQPAAPVRAQRSGTTTEITFTQQKRQEARQQLRRLLSAYDLDPWIFTREVRIAAGVDPHSHPILTLNTDFLDNDEMQLSIFLHEQAHWFVSRSVPPRAPEDAEEVAVIRELRQLFPSAPVPDYNAYLHLIVAWVELDAMAELIGEEEARQLLEDTQATGMILAKHDLIITPDKGLIVETNEDRAGEHRTGAGEPRHRGSGWHSGTAGAYNGA